MHYIRKIICLCPHYDLETYSGEAIAKSSVLPQHWHHNRCSYQKCKKTVYWFNSPFQLTLSGEDPHFSFTKSTENDPTLTKTQ